MIGLAKYGIYTDKDDTELNNRDYIVRMLYKYVYWRSSLSLYHLNNPRTANFPWMSLLNLCLLLSFITPKQQY